MAQNTLEIPDVLDACVARVRAAGRDRLEREEWARRVNGMLAVKGISYPDDRIEQAIDKSMAERALDPSADTGTAGAVWEEWEITAAWMGLMVVGFVAFDPLAEFAQKGINWLLGLLV